MTMKDLIKLAKNKEGQKILLQLLDELRDNTKAINQLNATLKKKQM